MTSRAVARQLGQGRWLSGCCWVAFIIAVVLGMTIEVDAFGAQRQGTPNPSKCLNGFTTDPKTGSCRCDSGFSGENCGKFTPDHSSTFQCENTCTWYVGKTTHKYNHSQAVRMLDAVRNHYGVPVIFPRRIQANAGCVNSYVGSKTVWLAGNSTDAMHAIIDSTGTWYLKEVKLQGTHPRQPEAYVFFEINGGCAQTVRHTPIAGDNWHFYLVTFNLQYISPDYEYAHRYCVNKHHVESHNWHPAWAFQPNMTTAARALVGNQAWLSVLDSSNGKSVISNGESRNISTQMTRLICLRTEPYDPTQGTPWFNKKWTFTQKKISGS